MNPFIIHVDRIEESAQPWEADLTREFLDEVLSAPPASEFRADGAAHVRAQLTKMGREVLVRGRLTVPLTGQCKRCLKNLHVDEPVEFTLNFVPDDGAEMTARRKATATDQDHKRHDDEGPRASFELAAIDEETYHGKELNLAPALREQVLLALPSSPLCDEACKGLCAVCGQDMNERDCGHEQHPPDPRWQALKDLRIEKKE
jgi:uncharacterized protein